MVHHFNRISNRKWREAAVVVVLVSGSTCWAVLRSHLLTLAKRSVARAAARTRDGMEALASMLPHLREDLQRRRTHKESWDLAHEDPGALGQDEDPLAEAKDTEDATSTWGPSELAALASETTASAAVSDADRKL